MHQADLSRELDRRRFLAYCAALAGPLYLKRRLPADTASLYPGQITRQKDPPNLEFPFASLDSFITPTDRFFTRCHFPIPKIDVQSWKLKVEGAVERPLELTYADLRKLSARTLTALLECAGNSRIFLVPPARGVGWELGAVGNAEWTGVPLAAVLEKAGVKSSAVEVVLEGADKGTVRTDPQSPGEIYFARSLPVERARHADTLLALQMNGVDLPPAHGFPMRALVPGWYGMASIKWLQRIVVTDRPFQGFFQTYDYSYFVRRDGLPTMTPITVQQVKSQIARPAPHEVLPANRPYRVHGAAWAGEPAIARVEVSTDAGKTWAEARLLGDSVRYAWRLWEFPWRTPEQRGKHTLMCRATDAAGRTQLLRHDEDRRNYMIHHVLPIEVEVR